ncbi:MAG: hypothetical protein KF784_07015 [Fimbriimonadaceae bacterium]|nr:hypothetical protein [Fimbriimonadaceae bacterium]
MKIYLASITIVSLVSVMIAIGCRSSGQEYRSLFAEYSARSRKFFEQAEDSPPASELDAYRKKLSAEPDLSFLNQQLIDTGDVFGQYAALSILAHLEDKDSLIEKCKAVSLKSDVTFIELSISILCRPNNEQDIEYVLYIIASNSQPKAIIAGMNATSLYTDDGLRKRISETLNQRLSSPSDKWSDVELDSILKRARYLRLRE